MIKLGTKIRRLIFVYWKFEAISQYNTSQVGFLQTKILKNIYLFSSKNCTRNSKQSKIIKAFENKIF